MTATPTRYEYDSENFPILAEEKGIRVFKNPCGELFIKDIESGVTMRVNRNHFHWGGLAFTTEGRVDPCAHSGMVVWHITAR